MQQNKLAHIHALMVTCRSGRQCHGFGNRSITVLGNDVNDKRADGDALNYWTCLHVRSHPQAIVTEVILILRTDLRAQSMVARTLAATAPKAAAPLLLFLLLPLLERPRQTARIPRSQRRTTAPQQQYRQAFRFQRLQLAVQQSHRLPLSQWSATHTRPATATAGPTSIPRKSTRPPIG